MRHGSRLYFVIKIRELREKTQAGGLDKIWRSAPERVQSGLCTRTAPKSLFIVQHSSFLCSPSLSHDGVTCHGEFHFLATYS
jgi:hypothetical protein